jgi:predicted metal-dependent hydrolase
MPFYILRRRIRRITRRRRARKAPGRPDYLARREAARQLAISRLDHFAAEYAKIDPVFAVSMRYNRVAIRNQRGRWGSCTSRKNLNFNYRILDLSPELRDYIIVHELCHLKELHHGKTFWDLVLLTIPQAMEYNRVARKMRIG